MGQKIIFTILICLLLSGCNLGNVVLETPIEKEIEAIEKIQEKNKTEKGKYELIKRYEKEGNFYEVHEYLTPKGERGYIVYLEETRADETYRKAIDYGVENRSFDWVKIDNENILDIKKATSN